ncbi:uncharacterized protein V1516DRAFT_669378 [Lipomyces oligophaga]|uniref:uncharacterized protein n=1 Tax=Lipomyces oligophaga TaxID=45792 RepID=UPI0034CF6138
MDKLNQFVASSSPSLSGASLSDGRSNGSSKRRRKHRNMVSLLSDSTAMSSASKHHHINIPSAPDNSSTEFNTEQFLEYEPVASAAAAGVLDPELANLSKVAQLSQGNVSHGSRASSRLRKLGHADRSAPNDSQVSRSFEDIQTLRGLILDRLDSFRSDDHSSDVSLSLDNSDHVLGENAPSAHLDLTREEAVAAAAAATAVERHSLDNNSVILSPMPKAATGTTSLAVTQASSSNSVVATGKPEMTRTWTVSTSQVPSNGVGAFTAAETEQLEHFMEQYGREHNLDHAGLCQRVWSNERRKDNFWESVYSALPHRTRQSVYKHVRRKYHVYELRGKWTHEEDEELKELADKHGAQWRMIGKLIGRMPEDCRDRWRNYVKCGNIRAQNKWSTDEEVRLVETVNQIRILDPIGDINWTAVSEKMGGIRSRIQCRYKWKKMSHALVMDMPEQ